MNKKNHCYFNRMCYILIVLVWLFAVTQMGIAEEIDNCVKCHSEFNGDIISAFSEDIHKAKGLSCADCHGGDPTEESEDAMDPKKGFVGAPDRIEQPEFCGKCHSDPAFMHNYNTRIATDQVDKYRTSRHGEKLLKGDRKVAVCASCHKAHGIITAKSSNSTVYPTNIPETCGHCHANVEYMAEYGIPTTQYEQYIDTTNVHGYALLVKRDISAPTCNDCHGNHGAVPPGIKDVARVCTQCHQMNGELFQSSPHKEAFDAFEISECAFCHQASPDIDNPHQRIHNIVRSNHALIGTAKGQLCGQCHSDGDVGWETANLMGSLRDSLENRLHSTEALLHVVEAKGFEISDAKWMFNGDVKQAKMELRTILHAFNAERYIPIFTKTDTTLNIVVEMGKAAAKDVVGRRVYFGIMTVLVLLMIIAIILKIRDISARQVSSPDGISSVR